MKSLSYRGQSQGSGSSPGCSHSGRQKQSWVQPGTSTEPPTPLADGPYSSDGPPCMPGKMRKRHVIQFHF